MFPKENYNEVFITYASENIICEIEQYKNELSIVSDNHDMIIVPQRLEANGQRLFAEESIDFIKFCKTKGTNVLISQRDCDGKLALHSSEIWLPIIYSTLASIPVSFVIGLLVNFISSKIGKKDKKKQNVNVQMIIKDGDKIKSLKYNGDAETFEEKFSNIDLNKWSKK